MNMSTHPPIEPAFDLGLNDLLAEALSQKADAQAVKLSRKKLSENKSSPEDKKHLQDIITKWENTREWDTVADVVMFNRICCRQCNSFSAQFSGFYTRQVSRSGSTNRWVRGKADSSVTLPKESKYSDGWADTCEGCAEAQGYEVEA